MINKQNLWFITLFSIIMVLSIYYLTMTDDTLSTLEVTKNNDESTEVVVSESDTIIALKVAGEEEMVSKIEKLEQILLDDTATIEEKNAAYEELQTINKNESIKENIQKIIKEEYKLDSYINIDQDTIKVTIASKTHDAKLANNIIRSIEKLYNENKYITVKFDN